MKRVDCEVYFIIKLFDAVCPSSRNWLETKVDNFLSAYKAKRFDTVVKFWIFSIGFRCLHSTWKLTKILDFCCCVSMRTDFEKHPLSKCKRNRTLIIESFGLCSTLILRAVLIGHWFHKKRTVDHNYLRAKAVQCLKQAVLPKNKQENVIVHSTAQRSLCTYSVDPIYSRNYNLFNSLISQASNVNVRDISFPSMVPPQNGTIPVAQNFYFKNL